MPREFHFSDAPRPASHGLVLADDAIADLAQLDALDVRMGGGLRLNRGFAADVEVRARRARFHEWLGATRGGIRRAAAGRTLAARARERGLRVDAERLRDALLDVFPRLG